MRAEVRSRLRAQRALAAAAAAGVLVPLALWASATSPEHSTRSSAAGDGARLATDLPCYLENRTVQLRGAGFPAGVRYTVSVDGATLGSGHVGPDGSFSGQLASGTLGPSDTHLRRVLSVRGGGTSASSSFEVTQFSAGFAPRAGDLATLVVRYHVFGFGVGPAAPKDPLPRPLYVHYIAPTGRQVRAARLGRTHGLCGSLPRTRRHRLFPFVPAAGTWHLQFDTRRRWATTSRPRVVQAVVVR